MDEITLKEYDNLPIIIQDDTLVSISSLNVGDLYLVRQRDEYVDNGSIITVYKVINKHNNRIESKPVILKVK
jgi:hypothetical protein